MSIISCFPTGGGGGQKASSWFGDGSDGNLVVTADYPIAVAEDTGHIFRQYKSLTIESGGILRPSHRCAGMVILVQGDLVVKSGGHINMDKMAPRRSETTENIILTSGISAPWLQKIDTLVGGNGGAGAGSYVYGGGYGGALNGAGGVGGNGHRFGGGYGGGGGGGAGSYANFADASKVARAGGASEPRPSVDIQWPYPGNDKAGNYGAGGGVGESAKGGAAPGGGGGSSYYSSNGSYLANNGADGDAYGGGLLMLVVGGNISIQGIVSANGGNGGNATATDSRSIPGGGGGGGGGILALLYRGGPDMSGNMTANGGSGGIGYSTTYNGVAGSIGTVYTHQVDNDLNIIA